MYNFSIKNNSKMLNVETLHNLNIKRNSNNNSHKIYHYDSNKILNMIKNLENISFDKKYKIGILIPTTNKGKNWSKAEDTFLWNKTIKTLLNMNNQNHNIIFYIGINIDDSIWLKEANYKTIMNLKNERNNIDFKFFKMINITAGHVTEMWNRLFLYAYRDNCDYFLQCGDDIDFITPNLLDECIRILKMHNNIGLTGPVSQNPTILTQTFVSRKHMEIFNLYFPSEIKNWYCDDWINQVYQPNYFYPLINHKCKNSGGNPRYTIANTNSLSNLINSGRKKLLQYLQNK